MGGKLGKVLVIMFACDSVEYYLLAVDLGQLVQLGTHGLLQVVEHAELELQVAAEVVRNMLQNPRIDSKQLEAEPNFPVLHRLVHAPVQRPLQIAQPVPSCVSAHLLSPSTTFPLTRLLSIFSLQKKHRASCRFIRR